MERNILFASGTAARIGLNAHRPGLQPFQGFQSGERRRLEPPDQRASYDAGIAGATTAIHKQVVWGDLDPFLPAKLADRFGGEVQHVTDCGHWVMLEDPERSATAIASLVESAR